MKFAIYTLAGVMIIATVTGLAISGGQPIAAPSRKPSALQTVYVDLNTLVRMHPAWQAVSITGSVINDAQAGSMRMSGMHRKKSPTPFRTRIQGIDPAIRQQLVADAIRVSDDAMMKLETAQLEAADMRLRQRRETMEKSAEAEVMAGVRDINEKAASDIEQIARRHCPDKINAELRVTALKLKSGKPGIDDKANTLKLQEAEAGLAQINDECTSETDGILVQAKAQSDGLWTNAANRIDATISFIESGEKRKIRNRAAASRNDILRELLSLYDAGNSITARRPSADWKAEADISAAVPVDSSRMDIDTWHSQNMGLERRIRQDVKSAVSRIARAHGMRVVFSRTSSTVPDQTKRFARLMSESAWNGCDPVLSVVGES